MAKIKEDGTALLLFTRSQQEEARVKDFSEVSSFRSNSLIAGHLISHAEKTARLTGLPCFVINSSQQHGNTFGEKLSDAFSRIFELGYANVIAIGNDCPTLSTQDLLTAAQQFKTTQAVIGPATDGGLYLIGLNNSAFDAKSFATLPWESDAVNEMMQAYLALHLLSYNLCAVKEDIDFGTQLNKFLRLNKMSFQLQQLIRSVISSIGINFNKKFQHPITIYHRIYTSLRAPPLV